MSRKLSCSVPVALHQLGVARERRGPRVTIVSTIIREFMTGEGNGVASVIMFTLQRGPTRFVGGPAPMLLGLWLASWLAKAVVGLI